MELISGLVRAFYSKAWYQKVSKASSKQVLLFLLYLILLTSILFAIRMTINLHALGKFQAQAITKQLPVMTLNKGKMETAKPRTYQVHYPSSQHKLLAVIQTHKNFNDFPRSDALIWIGHDAAYYKDGHEIHRVDYNNKIKANYTPKQVEEILVKHLDRVLMFVAPILYLLSVVILFPIVLIIAWLMAPFLKSMAKTLEYQLSSKAARNLAIAALSPFVLLLSILYVFNIFVTLLVIVLFLVMFAYPIIAVSVCRKKTSDK